MQKIQALLSWFGRNRLLPNPLQAGWTGWILSVLAWLQVPP